jgi:hypothetical protein
MLGSKLGSFESLHEPHIQTFCFPGSRHLLPGGRSLFDYRQSCRPPACPSPDFDSLRAWIASLRPYPTLALFVVPVIILEPAKPLAAYLTATDHVISGLTVLVVGEILKLVLIERLFSVSRDKLMSIRAFAWCYDKLRQAHDWIESLEAWRLMRRLSLIAKRSVRSYVIEMKTSQKQHRPLWHAH